MSPTNTAPGMSPRPPAAKAKPISLVNRVNEPAGATKARLGKHNSFTPKGRPPTAGATGWKLGSGVVGEAGNAPAFHHGTTQTYWCRSGWQRRRPPSRAHQFEVTDLQMDTQYSFSIMAFNKQGESGYSAELVQTRTASKLYTAPYCIF